MKTRALAAALILAGPASAMNDMEAMQLAMNLGLVLGSEEFCGLAYDQPAIAAFIAQNVPPDRTDFASMLQGQVAVAGFTTKDMTASTKTAHCATVAQTATQFGFIK